LDLKITYGAKTWLLSQNMNIPHRYQNVDILKMNKTYYKHFLRTSA